MRVRVSVCVFISLAAYAAAVVVGVVAVAAAFTTFYYVSPKRSADPFRCTHFGH